jgi:hypothetical protein
MTEYRCIFPSKPPRLRWRRDMRTLIILVSILLPGCVATIPMVEQSPSLSYTDEEKIVVSVIDKRKRVREGLKPPDFIGIAHGTYGIPADWSVYPTLTGFDSEKSMQTLAEFLEERILFGLNEDGWKVAAAGFPFAPSESEIVRRLEEEQAERLLLLTLEEWFVRINLNWVSAFNFDWGATVEVYDRQAQSIFGTSMSGRDVIDEEASESHRNHILRAYRDRLVNILEDVEVRQALVQSYTGASAQGSELRGDERESDRVLTSDGQGEEVGPPVTAD